MSKRLLVVGSNSIHVYNFIALVEVYFDDILLLTDKRNADYDISSIELDFHFGLNSLSTVRKITNIVQKFNPTTVHIHQANSYALLTLLALRNYNVQKILTAWGSDILINPKQSMLLKKMVQYILNNVDGVTADSNVVLYEANNLVSKNLKTYNINFGLDVPSCIKEKENIIYSNRLHKKLYNIDKVLISFSKYVSSFPEWRLVVAGNGEETENLKVLSDELGLDKFIEFIGFVDAQTNYEYYCKSKIYVSVPRSDSVSLSLVEAIICDCIPFVSEIDANKEIINAKLGFIVNDLKNIDFLKYEKINKVDFEKESKQVETFFSKDVNRKKYIALYEKQDED